MAKRSPAEQLDLAVSAMLARPQVRPVPRPSGEVAKLLTLVRPLRDLPRPEFKAALKSDLQRRTTMNEATASAPELPPRHISAVPISPTSRLTSWSRARPNSSTSSLPPSTAPSAAASRAPTATSCTPKSPSAIRHRTRRCQRAISLAPNDHASLRPEFRRHLR